MAIVTKTPGVYIEEVSTLPASVAQVETAIPAFIGFTELNVLSDPIRIRSMVEFIENFGGPKVVIDAVTSGAGPYTVSITPPAAIPQYSLYYAMQMYFANGGGPCWVISAGDLDDTINEAAFTAAFAKLKREDEPTLIVTPESINITGDYNVAVAALAQCAELQDRFAIIDLVSNTDVSNFRTAIGTQNLKYGAAYHPHLVTSLSYPDSAIEFSGSATELDGLTLDAAIAAAALEVGTTPISDALNDILPSLREQIAALTITLPPSSTIAGIYATVDGARGVWKAPANISVNSVAKPTIKINDADQSDLNVHSTGKSINAIRTFTGKGTLVWGSRTLDGNSNEWRYVPVRRLFITAEESIRKATEFVVFEPNDKNTWTRVRGMVENYLNGLWRQGALAGAKPEDAFFVKVGLGETMTSLDILEGKLIVEIGMAAVRPAEFIILRFSHKLQES